MLSEPEPEPEPEPEAVPEPAFCGVLAFAALEVPSPAGGTTPSALASSAYPSRGLKVRDSRSRTDRISQLRPAAVLKKLWR